MTREELIEALENAEGPSQELDAEIAGIYGIEPHKTRLAYDYSGPRRTGLKWETEYRHYTSSIDSALTLVPEGHWWTLGDCRREKHAHVAPEGIDDNGHEAFGATPAIALCIAGLKARGETP